MSLYGLETASGAAWTHNHVIYHVASRTHGHGGGISFVSETLIDSQMCNQMVPTDPQSRSPEVTTTESQSRNLGLMTTL